MSAKLATIAEKVRIAGRLLEEASAAFSGDGELVAKHAVIARSLEYEANYVNSIWGEMAGRAGESYVRWVKLGAPSTPAVVLSEVSAAVLRLNQAEWSRLAADQSFVYRDLAQLCSLIRARMEEKGFPRERLDELQRPAAAKDGGTQGLGEGGTA